MATWRTQSDPQAGAERVFLEVLDDLALAIFIVEPDLRVLESNAAAAELIAENGAIHVTNGSLHLERGDEHAALVRALSCAVGRPLASPSAYSVEVSDGSGPPFHLCIRALGGSASVARASRLAVYVIDTRRQPVVDGELLRRVYRLSPAEIRVVRELMQGQSVEAIAEMLSISIYTVRTHLKNLFAKTGTNRQGELIARLAASLGSLRVAVENHPFGRCAGARDPLPSEPSAERLGDPDASRDS